MVLFNFTTAKTKLTMMNVSVEYLNFKHFVFALISISIAHFHKMN